MKGDTQALAAVDKAFRVVTNDNAATRGGAGSTRSAELLAKCGGNN